MRRRTSPGPGSGTAISRRTAVLLPGRYPPFIAVQIGFPVVINSERDTSATMIKPKVLEIRGMDSSTGSTQNTAAPGVAQSPGGQCRLFPSRIGENSRTFSPSAAA